jgi:hypothetical protein
MFKVILIWDIIINIISFQKLKNFGRNSWALACGNGFNLENAQ